MTSKQAKIKQLEDWIMLLTATKKTLSTTYLSGICIALSDAVKVVAASGYPLEYNSESRLRGYIGKRLKGHTYVTGWLYSKCPEYKEMFENRHNSRGGHQKYITAVQQYRLEWINHMIQHFQSLINEYKGI